MRRLLLVVALLAATAATAATAAVLVPIAADARIEPGQTQSFKVAAPADVAEHKAALSLLARLDHTGLGGSTYAMALTLNGQALTLARLLNKPPETEMLSGLKLDWFGAEGWRVAYSPDYEAANQQDQPACLVGGHAYDFVLDVSDLVKPGPNQLVVRHSEERIPNALVLKDLALVDAPAKVASLEPEPDPNAPLPIVAPVDRSKVAYQLEVLPRGGLRVTAGKLALDVTSAFSYPRAGYNRLGRAAGEGEESAWAPVIERLDGRVTRVRAAGSSYRLERTITRLPDHVAVSDRFTNLTAGDVLICQRHAVSTAGLAGEVYLRGLRSRIMQGYDVGGENPTVLVRAGQDGVGLVAEDDVFRAQCAMVATAQPAEAALTDTYFTLDPGASYELRWSVYPVPNGDYFDFVNAIRRNWGTNFTIPGPFAFAPHPVHEHDQTPDLGAWLRNGGLRIVSLQIPMPRPAELSHGLAFLSEPEEQQRLKDQADRLRRLDPALKVLQYLHVYITRLDSAVDAYRDARHLGADGQQLTYPAGSWKPTFWLFLPTTTNAYGRAMNQTFDLVVDRLGFDGVYWDELAYSANPVAYQVTDGHSALPDMRTLTPQTRIALTPLYCQGYQVQQAQRVLRAGKLLIGNGEPVTETMTRLRFPRFVEAWHPTNLRYAHLYCPLGLSSPDRVRSEADIVPSIRSHLLQGGLWYYYCGWNAVKLTHPEAAAKLFPFTPVELHAGWLIGRERILTARSGVFGWGDRSHGRVYAWNADGTAVAKPEATERTIGGATYTELRLPPGGLGVIERVAP